MSTIWIKQCIDNLRLHLFKGDREQRQAVPAVARLSVHISASYVQHTRTDSMPWCKLNIHCIFCLRMCFHLFAFLSVSAAATGKECVPPDKNDGTILRHCQNHHAPNICFAMHTVAKMMWMGE
jgi:hypothetical protein